MGLPTEAKLVSRVIIFRFKEGNNPTALRLKLPKVDTVLELRALRKHYPTHRAVNGISLSIERGEFFSLVGPSGCGKTTTLRLIAGFEAPTSGEIVLDGRSVADLKPYHRDVSTVFQNYALFPHLTVARNITFGLERKRPQVPRSEIERRVRAVLELVQLSGKEARLPSELSGGERQRVALARSIVLEPQVLLLDEPLSALDPKLRKQMRTELKSMQRRVGISFLFITHDQEEALSMSDRMAVMNQGALEQIGTPEELYQAPQTRFVAEFLGEVNWLNGSAVRPEALRVSRTQPSSGAVCVNGVVKGSIFLGNCIQVRAQLSNGTECIAELTRPEHSFEVGDPVHLWWHRQDELRIAQP